MRKFFHLLCGFFAAVLAVLLLMPAQAQAAQQIPAAPAQTAFNRATDKCPCCNQLVTDWTELANITSASNLAAGHYVVSKPMQLGSYYNITGAKKVVIVFEDTLTAKDGTNALRAGLTGDANCQVWLLGGPNGKITGTGMSGTGGATTRNGSLMRFGSTAEVVIGGDLTVELSATATTGRGGLFDAYGSNVTMTGGTLNGVNSTASVDTYGAVVVRNKGSFTMTGGVINGGNVTQGGAIEVSEGTVTIGGNAYINCEGKTVTGNGGAICIAKGTLNIQGGTVIGGTATSGGAVYTTVGMTMTGGTIYGGTATNGGAICLESGDATLSGGTVYGGTATGNGGAVFLKTDDLTLSGATISGGSAKNGGCLYQNSGTTVTMTSGEMKLGTATAQGAIGFIKGTFNMSGGTVTANKASSGNARGLRVHDGTVNLSGNANIISCAKSTGDGLNVVSAASRATVSLDGNAQVWSTDDNINFNIVFHHYHDGQKYVPTMLKIKSGWTGKASVKFGHFANTEDGYAPGKTISAEYASSEGPFAGHLYLENDASLPRIYGKGTVLTFIGVELQTGNGYARQSKWFETNEQAVAAYAADESENKLLKLYTDDALDLAGNEMVVDFNGHTVAVTLSGGKLYGLDSTATTEVPGTAAVTVTDGKAELCAQNPFEPQRTVALTGESTGFHAVSVDITAANIRPGAAGVYYSARIACDDVLKAYVDQFGVAVSLRSLPGEDFAQVPSVLYTTFEGEKLGDKAYNGVLVQNIMHTGNTPTQNKKNAQRRIYANAYLQLAVGEETLTLMARQAASLSLKDMLQRVNGKWTQLSQADRLNLLENLYDPYIAQFPENDWNLYHMEAEKAGTEATKELKILTIGNSLSADVTRMLAYIAQQEGVQGIKIGTLYNADCSLQDHADFLSNEKAEYSYCESGFYGDAALTEGSLIPTETKGYTGKAAITAQDWDIIIMQHGALASADAATYDASIETIIRYVNGYKTNPNAVFAWDMTWMGAVDSDRLTTSSAEYDDAYRNYTKDVLDREAQTMMYDKIVAAVEKTVGENNAFAYILPSATMMQNALQATSDRVMYRDYIHGSDYGSLMNAYLWYSVLTGKTITAPAVTEIPGALRFAEVDQTSNLKLTQRQVNILVEAVNNAIETPFASTQSQYAKEQEVNVLAIGNSFAQDTTYYLEDIARAQGYQNVNIAFLYIGGCTLKTHAAKMTGNLADYTYYTNFNGEWVSNKNYTMEQAITSRTWDVVTLQQASHESGRSSTYEPYLGQLVDYIQEKQPNAKILWHMTWAYQQDSTHSGFPLYNNNQMTMYNGIVDAYNTAVKPYLTSGDMDGLMACGTAIQNARSSYVGDTLTRDGYHLSPLGRYMTGYMWFSILTGEDLTELDLTKVDSKLTLTDRDKAMIIECVNNALENPTEVTPATDKG